MDLIACSPSETVEQASLESTTPNTVDEPTVAPIHSHPTCSPQLTQAEEHNCTDCYIPHNEPDVINDKLLESDPQQTNPESEPDSCVEGELPVEQGPLERKLLEQISEDPQNSKDHIPKFNPSTAHPENTKEPIEKPKRSSKSNQIITSELTFGFPLEQWEENSKALLDSITSSSTFKPMGKLSNNTLSSYVKQTAFTIGVMCKNEGSITIPKHGEHTQWLLSDLRGNIQSVLLTSTQIPFEFCERTIVCIEDFKLKSVYLKSKPTLAIFLEPTSRFIKLGSSPQITQCKYIENQSACHQLIDRSKASFCHEHLRKEYFTVSSTSMSLNVNVGLGPVKAVYSNSADSTTKELHVDGAKKYSRYSEFVISSENQSNIGNHAWHNLPNDQQISKLLTSKSSMGIRYLKFESTTEKPKPTPPQLGIPTSYRNKRTFQPSSPDPPAKKVKSDNPDRQEKLAALLKKVHKKVQVVETCQ